jgi:hypothetical protein
MENGMPISEPQLRGLGIRAGDLMSDGVEGVYLPGIGMWDFEGAGKTDTHLISEMVMDDIQ